MNDLNECVYACWEPYYLRIIDGGKDRLLVRPQSDVRRRQGSTARSAYSGSDD